MSLASRISADWSSASVSASQARVRAQVSAAHAKPNQRARVEQISHQAFSHSAESSAKREPKGRSLLI